MKVDEIIFRNEIEFRCNGLDMPLYQRILLIEMICRKLEHPNEKINQLIDHATNSTVPEQYEKRGKSCMKVAVSTERKRLEQELHDCSDQFPEELARGDIVANVVEAYYAEVYNLLNK